LIEFDAAFYDGHRSASRPVRVRAGSGTLEISAQAVLASVPLESIQLEAPIGAEPHILNLPDGGQLRTMDGAAVQALFPRANALERWVHRLERHWPSALAGIAAVALFAGWVIVDGLPAAAKVAAGSVPAHVEAKLGDQTFSTIERRLCAPSKLERARQDAIQGRFAKLTDGLGDGYEYRLHLRECRGFGANAFALPGGIIVMTDALVGLADNDEQVAAVLAHEIGHVRARHGLRIGIQAAGVAALTAALFGDALSITGLATSLPAVLLQTGYSRGLEAEADEYAFARLKALGHSPTAFADILERMDGKTSSSGSAGADYFSTHPATRQRIERARAAVN
jgi:Zn-dependent protease with chaperone function